MPSLGPLVAHVPTPRDASGRVITATFESLVDGAIGHGARAIAVTGGVGGAPYLPRATRGRIVKAAVAAAAGRVPILAGVGDVTTASVLANVADAHKAGADGVMLSVVAVQPLTAAEVDGLIREVAADTPVGLWLQNNTAHGQYRFSRTELTGWARMRAVKGFADTAASASDARQRITRVEEELSPRTGRLLDHGFQGDDFGAQLLLAGVTTWHSTLAGVLPEVTGAIAYCAATGQRNLARSLQRTLTPVAMLAQQYGAARVAHEIGTLRGWNMGELPAPLLAVPRDVRSLLKFSLDSLTVPEAVLADVRASASARAAVPAPHAEAPARHRGSESS